jgi:hypothetical protein
MAIPQPKAAECVSNRLHEVKRQEYQESFQKYQMRTLVPIIHQLKPLTAARKPVKISNPQSA